jgi:diacylglycerol kinase (ATP)
MTKEVIKRTGLQRLLYTLVNSGRGFTFLLRHEEAFQLEALCAVILVPLALWLPANPVETVLLLGSLMLVLIVEVLNTAVEALTDRVGLEHHTLSGLAKDLGSLAVTLSLVWVLVVWGLIAWPYLSDLLVS